MDSTDEKTKKIEPDWTGPFLFIGLIKINYVRHSLISYQSKNIVSNIRTYVPKSTMIKFYTYYVIFLSLEFTLYPFSRVKLYWRDLWVFFFFYISTNSLTILRFLTLSIKTRCVKRLRSLAFFLSVSTFLLFTSIAVPQRYSLQTIVWCVKKK